MKRRSLRRQHYRILSALARGWRLRAGYGQAVILQRGRHVRGVRSRAARQLEALILTRGGRITEAGRFLLSLMEEGRC